MFNLITLMLTLAFFSTLGTSASVAQDAGFNSKSVQSITLRIVQNGQLTVAGYIERMNLTLYIPQDGVQSLNIDSNQAVEWDYANDRFGNKIVILKWSRPSGIVTYQLSIVVSNGAKLVKSLPALGANSLYLNRTSSIVINDDIRRVAYPFEKTWENVARLAKYVHDTVEYDISTVGQRYPSDWVLRNKRGVCVEHANLLTALLRASGIPTRYVVGYAYSSVDKKLIGHTWVEVLASDGTWVPFDPTWLQGGFVDATHIKTATLLDDNQVDVLSYVGTGGVKWKRGSEFTEPSRKLTGDLYSDTVEILDYYASNLTSIKLTASSAGLNDYGYIKAAVRSNACVINELKAVSCVDRYSNEVFDILEQSQSFFSCGSRDVYWFYKEVQGRGRYVCPVTVFDQIGSSESIDVEVGRNIGSSSVSISGPSVVNTGERFALTAAPSSFIFYSPEFGKNDGDRWELAINRPDLYKFYLYAASSLAVKTVSVVDQKAFSIAVAAPHSVKQGSTFLVNITVRNLIAAKTAKVGVDFDGQKKNETITFAQNEEKQLQFNLTANTPGQKEIIVLASSDTLTSYTSAVNVEGSKSMFSPDSGGSDGILGAVMFFFSSIAKFFANLF